MNKYRIAVLFLVLVLILSGCGSDKKTEEQSYKGNFEIIDEVGTVIVNTENLKSVSTLEDENAGHCVQIIFDEVGTEKFAEATLNNIGKTLYIYVDGNLVSSPTVQVAIINGEVIIQGFKTSLDAYVIVNDIKNGSDHPSEKTEVTEKVKDSISTNEASEKTTESVKPNQQTETTEQATIELETKESETKEEVSHRDGMFGISDKDIYDIGSPSDFARDDVRNDVTGKWRVSAINKSFDIPYYALSYYNKYFHGNDEIHAIVNFYDNTTTCISYQSSNLYVTVHEYVKGEEHDAKIMFSGTVIKDYIIYTDNGDIQLISE